MPTQWKILQPLKESKLTGWCMLTVEEGGWSSHQLPVPVLVSGRRREAEAMGRDY